MTSTRLRTIDQLLGDVASHWCMTFLGSSSTGRITTKESWVPSRKHDANLLCFQWCPAPHLATVTSARDCPLKVSCGKYFGNVPILLLHSLVCMNRDWGFLILFHGLSSYTLNSQIIPFGQRGQPWCLLDMPGHCVSTDLLSGLSWLFPAPGRWSISLNFFSAEVGI